MVMLETDLKAIDNNNFNKRTPCSILMDSD